MWCLCAAASSDEHPCAHTQFPLADSYFPTRQLGTRQSAAVGLALQPASPWPAECPGVKSPQLCVCVLNLICKMGRMKKNALRPVDEKSEVSSGFLLQSLSFYRIIEWIGLERTFKDLLV